MYFANATWSGTPILERIDEDISSEALAARPELRGHEAFSVEWSGALLVREPGLHRIAAKSDDGAWVWIDDQLVIDNGGTHPVTNVAADVPLTRGVHHVRIRYSQAGGESFLQLGQAGAGGRFVSFGPLMPTAMSYAEVRARELWPLALVLLWYCACGRAVWLAARHTLWFPHVRALAAASRDRAFLVVATLGLLVSAAHIAYGLPVYESLSGDELAPLSTLMASQSEFRGWNLRWPPLHMNFIALSLQPFQWAETLFGLSLVDQTVHALMFLVIRALSLAMLAATLLLTFDSAMEIADRLTGYFAVALLSTMPVVVYFGSLANLEIPQMFWAVLALWTWLKLVRWCDVPSSLVFGAVVGLGLASKDQLYGFYLPAPFALVYVIARDGQPRSLTRGVVQALTDRRFIAVGIATAIGFAVGHQLPIEWPRLMAHVDFMTTLDSMPFRAFEQTWAGHLGLLTTTGQSFIWAAGVPAACAFVGGTLHLAFSGRLRLLASLLLPLATYYVFFLAVILYVYDRFLIAFLPVAALVGGMFLCAIVRSPWIPGLLRLAIPAATLAAAALSAAGINVVFSIDPRHEARGWLAQHVACGSSVGIAYDARYVPPLDCYGVIRLAGSTVDAMSRYPDFLVFNEAYVSRFERTPSGGRFMARLKSGELGYQRVFSATTSPPRWAPLYWEARFRDGQENSETILDKPLHAIEVWKRQ